MIFLHPTERFAYYTTGGILLIASVIFIQLPLLNYLGYEYSAAVALVIPWLSGLLTIRIFRIRFGTGLEELPDEQAFRHTVLDAFMQNFTLLFVPLLIATMNAIFVRNCAYEEGLAYFLLIPIVTMVWSVALASLCIVLVRRAMVWYLCALILVLLHPFYLGYTTPQIFTYNFVYGFFQGFSYDEVLRIGAPLLLFRLVTLCTAFLFLVLASIVLQHRLTESGEVRRSIFHQLFQSGMLSVALIVLFLPIVLAWFFREPLGFESSPQYIQRKLGSSVSTKHFRIFYSKESFTDHELEIVTKMHEFRYDQLTRTLDVQYPRMITSYIYPTVELKRELMGAGNTNIAKPWRAEMHMNADSWSDVLKHEMVHVMAGEFGMPIIHAHYNIGLVEGLAMAMDPDFGNRTLDQYAAAMKKFGIVSDPARLIQPAGFAMQSSTVSYVAMGSFCKFLIDRYGMDRFKQLYNGSAVGGVYQRTFDELIGEWTMTLDSIPTPQEWKAHVEFYFKRPSIFAKECARAVANLNEEGANFLSDRQPLLAKASFHQSLETSWNTEAYHGFIRSAFAAAEFDTVVHLIRKTVSDSASRSSIINLFLLYGDALWLRGDTSLARQAYLDILRLDLSPRHAEGATVRLKALEDLLLRDSLPAFFSPALSDSEAYQVLRRLAASDGNQILLQYLRGKTFFRAKKFNRVVEVLEGMEDTALGSPILEAMREQLLAESYFQLRDYQKAGEHYRRSLDYIANEATRAAIVDAIERCEWFAKN